MSRSLGIPWSAYWRIAVSFPALPLEASPSPVYGAALLMRFGFTAHPGFKSPSLRPSTAAPGGSFAGGCSRLGPMVRAVERHGERLMECRVGVYFGSGPP